MKTLRSAGILGVIEVSIVWVVTNKLDMGVEYLCLVALSVVECPIVVVDQVLWTPIIRDTCSRSWQITYLETRVKWSNLVERNMLL